MKKLKKNKNKSFLNKFLIQRNFKKKQKKLYKKRQKI